MNTDSNNTGSVLSRRFKFIALTGAVSIFAVSTFAALWISFSNETGKLNSQTLGTTHQINEKVTSAIGTLHSMAAAHQASPTGFEQTQFELFAANLVTSQAAIAAAGRFNVLPYEDLELFKACLLYTSPSPRDRQKSRMPSSA